MFKKEAKEANKRGKKFKNLIAGCEFPEVVPFRPV